MDRRCWIAFSLATVCGPVSYLRKLDSLKYTSSIAILAVVYLTVIVVYYAIVPDFPLPESIDYFRFSTDFFAKLPIFIFAFTCHQNVKNVYSLG
jgi:amino acid permease